MSQLYNCCCPLCCVIHIRARAVSWIAATALLVLFWLLLNWTEFFFFFFLTISFLFFYNQLLLSCPGSALCVVMSPELVVKIGTPLLEGKKKKTSGERLQKRNRANVRSKSRASSIFSPIIFMILCVPLTSLRRAVKNKNGYSIMHQLVNTRH